MHGATNLSSSAACAVFEALGYSPRAILNRSLLGGGILLQATLVWLVFRRGIARRFPAFAALVSFYPLRALLLLALAGRIDADAYEAWYRVLAAAEVALLAWVCVELAWRLMRSAGGWSLRISLAVLVLVAAAFSFTWIALRAAPQSGLSDRVQIFVGFLMFALAAVAWKSVRAGRLSRNFVHIAAGFAAFAAFQWAALAGKALALAQRAQGAYVGWSYVPACGYLAVVVFWILALVQEV